MRLTSVRAIHVIGAITRTTKMQCTISREDFDACAQGCTPARGLLVAMAAMGVAVSAQAQEKKIKIGVIFDLTGPLAGGGSELQYIGAKIMLDQYAKTGVEGYKVEAVYADAQSKPDIAINEAVRLRRAGKGRHGARLLLLGAMRAGGGPRRAAQEVHVDDDLHLLGRARGQELQICLPPAGERRPVRPDDDGFHRPERQGEVRQGAEGSARRHHPRGRRLWRRRLEGQRGRRQEGRLQRRAEGGLFGHRARSLRAGDEAEARPARRDLPHRLQSRHHAVCCARRASRG